MSFLTVGSRVLQEKDASLWVTAQGRFADTRERPLQLRPGLGHLLRRVRDVTVVPLALEYPFWTERFPEALARLGPPIEVEDGSSRAASVWTGMLEQRLQQTQDELADLSVRRDVKAFDTLLRGRVGVGWWYDGWRAVRARVRGEEFHREHVPDAEAG